MKAFKPTSKFLTVFLLVTCMYAPSIRADELSFKDSDKQLHMAASFGVSLGLTSLIRKAGASKKNAFWTGTLLTLGLGLAKEAFIDPRFSKGDMAAWGIGTGIGSLTFLIVSF